MNQIYRLALMYTTFVSVQAELFCGFFDRNSFYQRQSTIDFIMYVLFNDSLQLITLHKYWKSESH